MATYHSSRGRSPRSGSATPCSAASPPTVVCTDRGGLPKTEGDYASIATAVMAPFVADTIDLDDFGSMDEDAYAAFSDPGVPAG